jgi:hypothetical protein
MQGFGRRSSYLDGSGQQRREHPLQDSSSTAAYVVHELEKSDICNTIYSPRSTRQRMGGFSFSSMRDRSPTAVVGDEFYAFFTRSGRPLRPASTYTSLHSTVPDSVGAGALATMSGTQLLGHPLDVSLNPLDPEYRPPAAE